MKLKKLERNVMNFSPLFSKAFEGLYPIWLMRQAGRYLPEYKKIRQSLPTFLDLCYSPSKACEVTLQPIQRYDFDAAIIFSDILVIPDKLGQSVVFDEKKGITLKAVDNWDEFIDQNAEVDISSLLSPVLEAVALTRHHLESTKSLIGFCGTPWTIASYMINGGKGEHFSNNVQAFIANQKPSLLRLLDFLSTHLSTYLIDKHKNGCDVLQIFDSWAGLVPKEQLEEIILKPLENIFKKLTDESIDIPIIYYGRNVSRIYKKISIFYPNLHFSFDENCTVETISRDAPEGRVIQGNLSPFTLEQGGNKLKEEVYKILNTMKGKPYIFNLGHGILKTTPPEHVAQLVTYVREFR